MNYFKVYKNATDELVVFGTAKECASFVGIAESWFRDCAEKGRSLAQGRYRVEIIKQKPPERRGDSRETLDAIAAWDNFVEPIRAKYGIPVYKAKPEVRG